MLQARLLLSSGRNMLGPAVFLSLLTGIAPSLVTASVASDRIARSLVIRDSAQLLPSYDYVIVGSGAGGLTVADRLSENPDGTYLFLLLILHVLISLWRCEYISNLEFLLQLLYWSSKRGSWQMMKKRFLSLTKLAIFQASTFGISKASRYPPSTTAPHRIPLAMSLVVAPLSMTCILRVVLQETMTFGRN